MDVVQMLFDYARGVDLKDKLGRPYAVLLKPHHGGVDASSAVLDHINASVGGFIAPVSMKPNWALLLDAGAGAFHAFMAGVVRGMEWLPEGAVESRRLAEVLGRVALLMP